MQIAARSIHFGPFALDLRSGELVEGDSRIQLQDKAFRVLTRLLEHPGELILREELRLALWPDGTYVDFDHGLNMAVKRLRAVLRDSAEQPRFIETVPRRGYRFVGRIEEYDATGVIGHEREMMDLRSRLEGLKSKLEKDLRELDIAIADLTQLIGEARPATRPSSPTPPFLEGGHDLDEDLLAAIDKLPGVNVAGPESVAWFANLSVQWSAIWYLACDVDGFATAGEIAAALVAGGYRTQAEKFPVLVDAELWVLTMRGEVETNFDGGFCRFRLTEQGKQTWQRIRLSPEFRHAVSSDRWSVTVK